MLSCKPPAGNSHSIRGSKCNVSTLNLVACLLAHHSIYYNEAKHVATSSPRFIFSQNYDRPRQHISKQKHHFANKGLYSQSYDFSSCHVQMWELDPKKDWLPKNGCFWIVVLEKTLESPLDCKEIKSVKTKGNKSWIFIGRTDADTLATWCEELTHWKRPWCWERLKAKGEGGRRGQKRAEEEMIRWHHWLNGHELE